MCMMSPFINCKKKAKSLKKKIEPTREIMKLCKPKNDWMRDREDLSNIAVYDRWALFKRHHLVLRYTQSIQTTFHNAR